MRGATSVIKAMDPCAKPAPWMVGRRARVQRGERAVFGSGRCCGASGGGWQFGVLPLHASVLILDEGQGDRTLNHSRILHFNLRDFDKNSGCVANQSGAINVDRFVDINQLIQLLEKSIAKMLDIFRFRRGVILVLIEALAWQVLRVNLQSLQ